MQSKKKNYSLELFFFFCLHFSCHEKAERVHELNEEIGKLLARAEQLGGEGNVDEAQQLLEMVEKTRALKKEAEVRNWTTALLWQIYSVRKDGYFYWHVTTRPEIWVSDWRCSVY